MRRPVIFSTALATAVAAELAVGTLLIAPSALADETPPPSGDPTALADPGPAPDEVPTAPTSEPPIRTGRTDDAPPAPAARVELPEASAPAVRTGRLGEVPAPDQAHDPDGISVEEPVAASDDGQADRDPDPGSATNTDRQNTDHQNTDHQSTGHQNGTTPRAPGPPSTSASDSTRPALGPASRTPVPEVPLTHTVVAGDNLWEIAAAHLATVSGRSRSELSALDIAPYWSRVCMANRQHLISGDVSLVYAGEEIELPAI